MQMKRIKVLDERLNKAVLRQRLLIEEAHCQRIKCIKRLRIFTEVTQTHIKISGLVLSDLQKNDTRFFDVIKRIYILKDDEVLEWVKKRKNDTFLVEKGNKMELIIDFENLRDKFRLSEELQLFLNRKTETKTGVLVALWKYVRLNKLISKGIVKCDEKLRNCFGVDSFKIEELNLDEHLLAIDNLFYELNLEKNEVFDVELEMDDLVDFPVLYSNRKITGLERKINEVKQLINACECRVDVLEEFAIDPVSFIDKNALGGVNRFFYDPSVQDLVFKLMNKGNKKNEQTEAKDG